MAHTTGCVLLMAGLFFSLTALAAPVKQPDVATLINQRLAYMKDVAGYKAAHHLPIEDLVQEDKVLASSVKEAESLGLDGDSVRPFVQAQMDAAKAIQYRYRADWLATPDADWQPAPLDQVREKIGALSSEVLQGISAQLHRGDRFTQQHAFIKSLNQPHLSEADKLRLWKALQRVTLMH